VGLEIRRSGRDEMRRLVLDEDRRRRPAGAGTDAAGLFERREEAVADERMAPGEPVPGAGVEAGDARGDLRDDFGFAVGHPAMRLGSPR
jgi:hypothetical protein